MMASIIVSFSIFLSFYVTNETTNLKKLSFEECVESICLQLATDRDKISNWKENLETAQQEDL